MDKPRGGKKNIGRNREREEKKGAWKKRPPKQGEKNTKTFQGKTYHWCMKHKQWTVHKPSECHLKEHNPREKKIEVEAPEETKLSHQALRSLIKLAAVGEESDEEWLLGQSWILLISLCRPVISLILMLLLELATSGCIGYVLIFPMNAISLATLLAYDP